MLKMRYYKFGLIVLLMTVCFCNEAKENDNFDGINPKHVTPIPLKQYDTIYLTFDDGPQKGTAECLELCKKLKVKATFFIISNQIRGPKTKEIMYNMRKAYPEILVANHSTNHANGHYRNFYHHPEYAANDFFMAHDKLALKYKIIRLPGNSAWVTADSIKASSLVKPVCKLLDSAKFNVLGWDVEWDFNHRTQFPIQSPKMLFKEVDSAIIKGRSHTKHNLVILTHDRMFRDSSHLDSLAKFIKLLKKDSRFVFETLNNYPGLYK